MQGLLQVLVVLLQTKPVSQIDTQVELPSYFLQ